MAFTACWSAATPRDETRPIVVRTATPAINRGKWRHSVALSEFEAPFLNGVQRSVNRKVQGSNPWSGAILKRESSSSAIVATGSPRRNAQGSALSPRVSSMALHPA